jgi:hypothetical protein
MNIRVSLMSSTVSSLLGLNVSQVIPTIDKAIAGLLKINTTSPKREIKPVVRQY